MHGNRVSFTMSQICKGMALRTHRCGGEVIGVVEGKGFDMDGETMAATSVSGMARASH